MKTVVTGICMFVLILTGTYAPAKQKSVIGETAWIDVGGVQFSYLARIDTGARTTSLHAVDVKVIDGSPIPEKNVGRKILFTTINREGKTQTIETTITRVSTITNSHGSEVRYVIELPLSWKTVNKTVEVNLRDRSQMKYKLLLGRNWLSKEVLVDVDMKAKKGDK